MRIKAAAITFGLAACMMGAIAPSSSAQVAAQGTVRATQHAGSIAYKGKTIARYSFADHVALPKQGCARFHIKYTIDTSVVYPKSYIAFSLTSKATTTSAMEYVEPGNGTTLPGKDPWVGTEEIVLCATGQQFVDTYGETKLAPPFKKGKYSLVAFLNVIQPVQTTVATAASPVLVQ